MCTDLPDAGMENVTGEPSMFVRWNRLCMYMSEKQGEGCMSGHRNGVLPVELVNGDSVAALGTDGQRGWMIKPEGRLAKEGKTTFDVFGFHVQ